MTHMLGQAKHRLKELEQSGVDTEPIGEAIEALEGELSAERGRIASSAYFMTAVAARDAVIAEARGWANAPVIESDQPAYRAGYGQAQYEVRDIFSRVPQGAAEPWTDPEPYVVLGDGWEQRLAHPDDNESKHTPRLDPRSREQFDAEEGNR